MINVTYLIETQSSRVVVTRLVNGKENYRAFFELEGDVRSWADSDTLFYVASPTRESVLDQALRAVRSLRRAPWFAEVATSPQGFPEGMVPSRMLNRRVKVTIEDLGPAE